MQLNFSEIDAFLFLNKKKFSVSFRLSPINFDNLRRADIFSAVWDIEISAATGHLLAHVPRTRDCCNYHVAKKRTISPCYIFSSNLCFRQFSCVKIFSVLINFPIFIHLLWFYLVSSFLSCVEEISPFLTVLQKRYVPTSLESRCIFRRFLFPVCVSLSSSTLSLSLLFSFAFASSISFLIV